MNTIINIEMIDRVVVQTTSWTANFSSFFISLAIIAPDIAVGDAKRAINAGYSTEVNSKKLVLLDKNIAKGIVTRGAITTLAIVPIVISLIIFLIIKNSKVPPRTIKAKGDAIFLIHVNGVNKNFILFLIVNICSPVTESIGIQDLINIANKPKNIAMIKGFFRILNNVAFNGCTFSSSFLTNNESATTANIFIKGTITADTKATTATASSPPIA